MQSIGEDAIRGRVCVEQTSDRHSTDSVLAEIFGLKSFRPLQREIIEALLASQSVLGILPTGAGKSLCYQLPSQILGGLTIVVSPLIALMRDQVRSLRDRGIWAAALHHHQSGIDQEKILAAARTGVLSLLYVSPERLRQPRLVRTLAAVTVSLLVVDEAHLISQWGHDFRPDYQGIRDFRERVGLPPVLAVTATATPRVKRDIIQALALDHGPLKVVEGSVDRPNLNLSVRHVASEAEKFAEVARRVKAEQGAVLIYTDSRARTETWARQLHRVLKEPVSSYHAGMAASDRQMVEQRFLQREVRVVAATNAFGMGVDRGDIRLVIHVGIPESLDAYYQEIGRGGRDGEPGQAFMVWHDDDLRRRKWRLRQDQPDPGIVVRIVERLASDLPESGSQPWRWEPNQEMIPVILALLEEMGYVDIEEKALTSARIERLECPWPVSLGELLTNRLTTQYRYRLQRFQAMEEYLGESGPCRRERLLQYFGQALTPGPRFDCCDRCQGEQGPGPVERSAEDLMSALRAWRYAVAREKNVAPYLVFQDRVLQDICQRMPMTLEQLSGCHGVGPKKIESFGLELLAIVKAHAISPEVVPASEDSALARAFSLFESSVAFSQVLERIPRSASTVLGYLERWMSQADIDVVRAYGFSLVKTETYDLISEAFALEGDDRLRPVMDRLQGTVTYQDLRVARAIYRRSREEKLKDVPRQ